MKAKINKDRVELTELRVQNSGSVNYYEIECEFNESWDGLTKEIVIAQETEGIHRAIINNKAYIDKEYSGRYTIGFVGYTIEDEVKTYQISTNLVPIVMVKGAGEISITGETIPTPSEWETYIAQIEAMIDDIEDMDIDVSKEGTVTTATITKKNGTVKSVEILDGEKGEQGIQGIQGPTGKNLEFTWNGKMLGVRQEGETEYSYVDLGGPKGDKGDTGEQGPKGDTGEQGPKGDTGNTGATGNGISSIQKTGTVGLVDTYTIYFTDGTTTTFTVTNGAGGGGGSVDDVRVNGVSVVTDGIANINVPTALSELNNDLGFIDDTYHDNTKQDKITSANKLDYSLLNNTPTIPTVPTNVSAFTNDVGYITITYHDDTKVDKVTGKGLSANDYTNTEKSNVASNTTARHTHSNKSILDDITASYTTEEKTKLAGLSNYDDTALSGRVTTIEGKIPAQATSTNQVADKDFVNSTIGTNTAIFRGTYNTLAELQAQTATNNDYGFVRTTDSAGNTLYNRHKYNGTRWVFEYSLNNSSFTAQQWASIQSGITQALVDLISTNQNNIATILADYIKSTDLATNSKAGLVKKSTTISSASTDDNVVTPKAVYDYIQSLDANNVEY